MLLCKITPSHAVVLSHMHASCFPSGWNAQEFMDLISLPTTIGWINDTGFILCSVVCDEMEILTIGVLPSHQRQGLGKKLLQCVDDYALSHHIHHIFLEVSEQNLPAQKLYNACGYQQIGIRTGYYSTPSGTVDALCLSKKMIF